MKFYGRYKDGKFHPFNAKDFKEFTKSLEGELCVVDLSKRGRRSLMQNAYLHVLFGMLRDGFNTFGNNFDLEEVKELCKRKFLMEPKYVDGVLVGEVMGHTSKLNKEEFSDFIEQIKAWAAEFNIYLPDAGEQQKLGITNAE